MIDQYLLVDLRDKSKENPVFASMELKQLNTQINIVLQILMVAVYMISDYTVKGQ
jgi:hypothetical protein